MRPMSSPCLEVMPRTHSTDEFNSRLSLSQPCLTANQLPNRPPLSTATDRLRARSPSSSPLTKRTKLHRDRTSRKTSGNLPAMSSHLDEFKENSRVTDSVVSTDLPSPIASDLPECAKVGSDIKTGNLVMVSWPRSSFDRSRSRSYPSESRAAPRCPCIVQVCQRVPEHWAVVRRTKHRLTEKPQFLTLKRCRVTRTRACQFTVHLDGAEGKTYSFEASSPEQTDDWVRVFTPAIPPASELCSLIPRIRKPVDSFNCVILEEEEEDDLSLMSSTSTDLRQPLSKHSDSCDNVIIEEEEEEEETFLPSSKDNSEVSSLLKDQQDIVVSRSSCFVNKDMFENSQHWRDVLLRDGVTSRSRTTSLPVLYEEDEIEP